MYPVAVVLRLVCIEKLIFGAYVSNETSKLALPVIVVSSPLQDLEI